jgi:hypothetical protein
MGDFNGDGLDDIALGSPNGILSIMLSEADGGFYTIRYPLEGSCIPALTAVPRVSAPPDLAIALTDYSALIILRNAGDGTFTDGGLYPVAGLTLPPLNSTISVSAIYTASPCGPAIVATENMWTAPQGSAACGWSGTAVILSSDGDGGFVPPVPFATYAQAPVSFTPVGRVSDPAALAVGDFCGGVEVLGNQASP